MSDYHSFTAARTTEPDFETLVTNLRVDDATTGVQHTIGTQVYIVKKATTWTATQITSAQNVLDTAPSVTPQRLAQNQIDQWSIMFRALVLALIDQLNVIRAALPTPKPAITTAQALQAIRDKAGTL